jgi:hypothetical protein
MSQPTTVSTAHLMNWTAGTSSGWVRRQRLTRRHGLQTTQHRAIQGFVRRLVDGKEEIEACGHAHQNRTTALKCAQSWANQLNKDPGQTP